jgi:hypothetical protein
MRKSTKGLLTIVVVASLLVIAACSPAHDAPSSTRETPEATSTPTDVWSVLLRRTPYPYTTPLPPANPTVLDGTYVKLDPRPGERAPCRRCPPYPPEGGIWRLHLDRGTFRVVNDLSGWRTLGSFSISGSRVLFFNDPHCNQDTGIYAWKLEAGELMLEVVEDNCAYGLRAQSFVALPWESCQPPSTEAAVTSHWQAPLGCDTANINSE